jgi:hypothetical protein
MGDVAMMMMMMIILRTVMGLFFRIMFYAQLLLQPFVSFQTKQSKIKGPMPNILKCSKKDV